jgi:hypothetical protein
MLIQAAVVLEKTGPLRPPRSSTGGGHAPNCPQRFLSA